MLMLSRDNPNVNETVEKIINDAMKKVNAELLNIGTCNLHVIHNEFKVGTGNLAKIKTMTDRVLLHRDN